MEDKLQVKFDYLFRLFYQDEQVNVRLKQLIIENLGLEAEIKQYIQEFLRIAKTQAYTYSTGLGYAMLFWCTYGEDIDAAIAYNEKARSILMSLDDYQMQEGILTVVNNAVIAYILKEDYGVAYQELCNAMPWAEKEDRITYYAAFLNNGAAILSEFGLYEKAIQQVEETLLKRRLIGESNYFKTVFLLSNLYINVKDSTRAKRLLKENLEAQKSSHYFNSLIFEKQLIECAILDCDQRKAKRLFDRIIKQYEEETFDQNDRMELHLTFAHYYMFIEDYEQAEKYYVEIAKNFDQFLGSKRVLLHELAKLYACKKDYVKASKYESLAYERSERYDRFVDDLYREKSEDVWEKNRQLSYEVMYKQLLQITEAGRHIASVLTWEQLFQMLHRYVPPIVHYERLNLILVDYEEVMYHVQGNERILIPNDDQHYVLKDCVKQGKAICLDNVNVDGNMNVKKSVCVLLQPIIYQGKVIAISYLDVNQKDAFSESAKQLLNVLSDYLSIAIINIQQYLNALDKSSYDYLTSSYNRGGLVKQGEQILKGCKKRHDSIGAMMIDIDDFKKINDTHGHMFGDVVIQTVTNIMDKHKKHGVVARFGGEEFTLLIDGITKDALYQCAEIIRCECETTFVQLDQESTHFTISIGCAYQNPCDIGLLDLLDVADQKLYIAKNNGKNCIQM